MVNITNLEKELLNFWLATDVKMLVKYENHIYEYSTKGHDPVLKLLFNLNDKDLFQDLIDMSETGNYLFEGAKDINLLIESR